MGTLAEYSQSAAPLRDLKQVMRRHSLFSFFLLAYAISLLGVPALVLLGIVIQPGGLASFHDLTPLILVSYSILYMATFFGGGPLGEETDWRGFALPRMQLRYGPLWGTLPLGVLWSCWHLSDFLTASKEGGAGTGFTTFLTTFPIFPIGEIKCSLKRVSDLLCSG